MILWDTSWTFQHCGTFHEHFIWNHMTSPYSSGFRMTRCKANAVRQPDMLGMLPSGFCNENMDPPSAFIAHNRNPIPPFIHFTPPCSTKPWFFVSNFHISGTIEMGVFSMNRGMGLCWSLNINFLHFLAVARQSWPVMADPFFPPSGNPTSFKAAAIAATSAALERWACGWQSPGKEMYSNVKHITFYNYGFYNYGTLKDPSYTNCH